MSLHDKVVKLKIAVDEFDDLMREIKEDGMPPHPDYYCQSIYTLKMKVKKAYKSLVLDV